MGCWHLCKFIFIASLEEANQARNNLNISQATSIRRLTLFLYHVLGIPTINLHPKRDLSGFIVSGFGCLVIYFMFYEISWIWASGRRVADLIDDRGVWKDFQAKVDIKDALLLLTRCLNEAAPRRYATMDDFSFCLRDIGVHNS
jgi:hypothetical protein